MNTIKRKTVGFTILTALLLSIPAANAQNVATIGKEIRDVKVKTGDRAEDEIWLFDSLRGAVSVFYFWRPSNLASVEMVAEMKALHDQFSKQGVYFVSITAAKKEKADPVELEHGFGEIFRFIFDDTLVAYYHLGAFSEPYVVLVDPRSVLVWRGAPDSRLEQRIADLVERSKPPLGDEQWLDRRYSKAERLFEKGDFARAYTVAHGLFKLTDNSIPVNGKAEALIAKCEAGAKEKLKEAVQLESDGELEEAARIVAEIAVRFEDPDEGKDDRNRGRDDENTDNVKRQAEELVGRMNGDRKLKKIIRDAMEDVKVEVLLDRGEDLEEDGYYRLAKETYVKAIKEHEDADAAEEAKKRVIRIKTDKDIQAKIAEARESDAAWRLLSIAEHFEGLEKYKEAREYYERVVAEHDGTVAAARAAEWMKKLPKASADEQTATAKP